MKHPLHPIAAVFLTITLMIIVSSASGDSLLLSKISSFDSKLNHAVTFANHVSGEYVKIADNKMSIIASSIDHILTHVDVSDINPVSVDSCENVLPHALVKSEVGIIAAAIAVISIMIHHLFLYLPPKLFL